jgi:signal transduction histidine kinase
VGGCVDALRPELATAVIALETALDPGVVISANEGRMRRVILNILRNLIRYAPQAPARISVSVEAGAACVVCADEGPGWPAGDPEALTDAFVRGEASRSRATGGSGLGLSIVRTTVNAYGGSVALTRGASGGAVVTLRLPLAG